MKVVHSVSIVATIVDDIEQLNLNGHLNVLGLVGIKLQDLQH